MYPIRNARNSEQETPQPRPVRRERPPLRRTHTRTRPMPSAPAVKIVVPDDFPPALTGSVAEAPLQKLGQVRVFTERGADQEQTLIERIGDAEVALNIRAHARFTDRVLAACPKLRLISIWGAGTDNVDLAACKTRGVTVTNTPGVNAHALAEHTVALMLAVTRKIPAMDRDVRAGQWPRGLLTQLEGRTLGLIGLGAIGSRVAVLARPFGMRLLTPHNGGMTREVIDGGVLRAVENIQLFLDGQTRDVVVAPPVR